MADNKKEDKALIIVESVLQKIMHYEKGDGYPIEERDKHLTLALNLQKKIKDKVKEVESRVADIADYLPKKPGKPRTHLGTYMIVRGKESGDRYVFLRKRSG
jgi:hypothetical protein